MMGCHHSSAEAGILLVLVMLVILLLLLVLDSEVSIFYQQRCVGVKGSVI
jgi:lipopolysaccharide/colanic/teichoic acid biosynthesis glycosyltransferase